MDQMTNAQNWARLSDVIATRFPAANDAEITDLLNDEDRLLHHLAKANDLTVNEARELYELALLQPDIPQADLRAA